MNPEPRTSELLNSELPSLEVPPPATPDSLTPQFPAVVDATMRREYLSCPRAFYFRYILGLTRATGTSIHLLAGGAFAAGCETVRHSFYDTTSPTCGDADASIALGIEALLRHFGDYSTPHLKSPTRMSEALDYYFSVAFPLTSDRLTPLLRDGVAQVEFSFLIPLVSLPDISYAGRYDGFFTDGISNYILDDKTTSALGQSWVRQWDLRSQFTGYVFAATSAGIRVSGCVVRGISILKTKFGHAEVITQRTSADLDRWWEVMNLDFQRAYSDFCNLPSEPGLAPPLSLFPPNLDSACCAFSGCQFCDLCRYHTNPLPHLPEFTISRWQPQTGTSE